MATDPQTGQPRSDELDALRLALLVEQFGSPEPTTAPTSSAAGSETAAETTRSLVGEDLVRQLDHLVDDATALTYVLIDQVARDGAVSERRDRLAWHLRRLLPELGNRRGGSAELGRPIHRFEPATWKRWDGALSILACRGLLRLDVVDGKGDGRRLRYTLTIKGREELLRRLEGERNLQTLRERCRLLSEILIEPLAASGSLDGSRLGGHLREVGTRLERFRHDERIGPGDDLLGRFFQKTFGELP